MIQCSSCLSAAPDFGPLQELYPLASSQQEWLEFVLQLRDLPSLYQAQGGRLQRSR